MRTCVRCGKEYEPQKVWQRYCSATCRVLSAPRAPYNASRRKAYGGTYVRLRKLILAASDVCGYCGQAGADTADHIIPVAYGGESTLDNLRPAHRKCNSAAGGRMSVHPSKGQTASGPVMPRARASRWG